MIFVNEEEVAVGGNMTRPANATEFVLHSATRRERRMPLPFHVR